MSPGFPMILFFVPLRHMPQLKTCVVLNYSVLQAQSEKFSNF
jgi:hypothetical protein